MLDAIALGELLIDFATVDTDRDGYPTLAAHPGGAPGNFLAALQRRHARQGRRRYVRRPAVHHAGAGRHPHGGHRA